MEEPRRGHPTILKSKTGPANVDWKKAQQALTQESGWFILGIGLFAFGVWALFDDVNDLVEWVRPLDSKESPIHHSTIGILCIIAGLFIITWGVLLFLVTYLS